MEDNKDIEKVSREVFDNLKMDPPINAWDKLDADLDKRQAAIYKQRSNRFKLLSIALLFIIFSFITLQYLVPKSATKKLTNGSEEIYLEGNRSNSNTFEAESNLSSIAPSRKSSIPKNASKLSEKNIQKVTGSKPPASKAENLTVQAKPMSKTEKVSLIEKNNKNIDKGDTEFQADRNESISVANQIDQNHYLSQKIIDESDSEKLNTTENTILERTVSENNFPKVSDVNRSEHAFAENSSPALIDSNKSGPVNDEKTLLTLTDSNNSEPEYFVNKDSIPNNVIQPQSRLSLAIYYSPNKSWCNLIDNTNDNFDDVLMYNNRENSKYSFTTGFNLKYDLNTQWSLISGAAYSTITKSISIQTMYAKANANNEMHFEYPTSNGVIEMPADENHPNIHPGDSLNSKADCNQSIMFINVPLMVRFQVTKKKFTGYVNAGLSANFIVREKAKIFMDNSETTVINHVNGLKKMNYGFLIGAGVQYSILDDLGIFIEPVFRGSFSSITNNMAVNSYPYSLGLNLGFSLHF